MFVDFSNDYKLQKLLLCPYHIPFHHFYVELYFKGRRWLWSDTNDHLTVNIAASESQKHGRILGLTWPPWLSAAILLTPTDISKHCYKWFMKLQIWYSENRPHLSVWLLCQLGMLLRNPARKYFLFVSVHGFSRSRAIYLNHCSRCLSQNYCCYYYY